MESLHTIRCVACEGGVPPLSVEEIKKFLTQLPQWTYDQQKGLIYRRFTFKGFYKTMAFVNAIAWVANQEDHHPDLEVGYDYCVVKYMTHAVKGLTKNDFICAAKVDQLEK